MMIRRFLFALLISALFVFPLCPRDTAAAGFTPTSYKSEDFKKDILDLSGLTEEQTALVLELLNNNSCTCGCKEGSWANCMIHDKHCPFSRPMGAKVAAMIKEGKSETYVLGYFAGWFEGAQRRKKKRAKKDDDPDKIYPVVPMNAPVRGAEDGPVLLIEYTDYQCPFCFKVQPTIESLLKKYEGALRHVVMNNPLSFHKAALPAALAARAAGRQGKFWEMHKMLFPESGNLTDERITELAQKLGLDMERFDKDRRDESLKAEIMAEQKQARKNGASGTPAFFVNGKKLSGARPQAAFETLIESMLQETKEAKGKSAK